MERLLRRPPRQDESQEVKPLAIDLFCGLGGWTEGLMAEGYHVIGFDIERHDYGDGKRYPSQLVLQDVLTIHGKQFKDAALIVASPPCQEYSYMAMPWSRAKAIAKEYREGVRDVKKLTALFDACFRIQREAIEAAGHFMPLVVENVRGAQPWVGRSRWNFGSFHLWGDVPALMPMTQRAAKVPGLDWNGSDKPGYVARAFNTTAEQRLREEGQKVPGFRFDGSGRSFQTASVNGMKGIPHKPTGHWTNPAENGTKQGGDRFNDSQPSMSRLYGSKSPARKAASAAIAKIPFPLAQHIARVWHP